MRQRILAIADDGSGNRFVFGQALELLATQAYGIRRLRSRPPGPYLLGQVILFIKVLLLARKKDIIYLHSILPFGAALAGKLRGCRIIYHIHEVSKRPPLLRRILMGVVKATARQCVFTSHYVREQAHARIPGKVIYSPLPLQFTNKVPQPVLRSLEPFTVLMICPMRSQKGLMPFVESATALPGLRFELVLDARNEDIDILFSGLQLPPNLFLHETPDDIHPFYARASVVLNLSRPDQWIGTFDETVLEAMYYGRPVIIPPAGGITELVEDGSEGFYADSGRIQDVVTALCILSENTGIYTRMSQAAYKKARCFSQLTFERAIINLFRAMTCVTSTTDPGQ